MYIALTGSENNKDVYIYHSFRKENGKSSSRIYKKLGKYNTLLEQFDGDRDKMMAWAREQADKETKLYKEATGKISVEFSKAACIPMNERRSFNVGYLFLQELCTQLRIDKICRTSHRSICQQKQLLRCASKWFVFNFLKKYLILIFAKACKNRCNFTSLCFCRLKYEMLHSIHRYNHTIFRNFIKDSIVLNRVCFYDFFIALIFVWM